MFDVPLNTATYVNKHRVRERQLRYRYINEHTKQYKKYKRQVYKKKLLKRKYSDKKYESSVDEDFNNSNYHHNRPENEKYLIPGKNRKRTKWTTLYRQDTQELESENTAFGSTKYEEDNDESETGDTYNDNINDTDEDDRIKLEENDHSEEEEEEEEAFISSKDERKYFSHHHKPQQTYELWMDPNSTTHRPLQTSTIRFPEWSRIETKTRSKLKEPLAQTTHSLKAYQKLIPYGLYLHDPYNIRSYHKRPTIQDKHIETMIILLRVHISKLNWSMAYRIFALLIRIPRVDIRSIWQYGVAILNQSENPVQCLTFLEWMHSVFSSKKTYHLTSLLQSDPVFRGSSRNHTAQFSLTWLWNSLISYSRRGHQMGKNRHDYEEETVRIKKEEEYDGIFLNKYDKEGIERLIEKIKEMVLSPPYMEDGEVWFILAMCHMVRADYTSLCYLNGRGRQLSYRREKLYNHVTHDINEVIKCLKESKARQDGDFFYPEDYIMRSLTQIELRVSEEEEEEEETEASLSDDTNKSTHISLPNKEEEEEGYQLVSQTIDESHLQPELESSSFQVEEENSFLQTLDMPDYLVEDDYGNQYDDHDNYYTNRDSDDREYSSD